MARHETRELFSVLMGVPVPTLEEGSEDQRDALAAVRKAPELRTTDGGRTGGDVLNDALTEMERWEAAGYPCDDCGESMRTVSTDEGGAWRCDTCGLTIV